MTVGSKQLLLQHCQIMDKNSCKYCDVYLEYFRVCRNLFIPRFVAEPLTMFCETLGVQEILLGIGCSVKRLGHYIRNCLYLT